MTQPFRLQVGGAIDRSRLFSFRFDGREYEGHPGDTLASALLANGVRVVSRSFKYHRPRGIFAAGVEEKFELLAENPMGERVIASPVPANNRLLIRGDKHLFCVGK